MIHRDIKPAENMLLHDGSALLADFGIALAISTVFEVRSRSASRLDARSTGNQELIGLQ